jgi:hypothetical protein
MQCLAKSHWPLIVYDLLPHCRACNRSHPRKSQLHREREHQARLNNVVLVGSKVHEQSRELSQLSNYLCHFSLFVQVKPQPPSPPAPPPRTPACTGPLPPPVPSPSRGLSDSFTVGRPLAAMALQTRRTGRARRRGSGPGNRWSAACPSRRTPGSGRKSVLCSSMILSSSSPSEKMMSFWVGSSPRAFHQSMAISAPVHRVAAIDADAGPARQPVGGVLQEPLVP